MNILSAKKENKLAIIVLWAAGLFILLLLAVFLGYILYKGEFYNIINVFKLEEDDYFEFIIPIDYKINEDKIIKLYKYASND